MKKDNLEAIYPLSPTQEGMLFHSLYAPQQEIYFEQFAYTLQGELDRAAFKEAWRQIVAAHPVLRTLFLWEGQEKPLQVVLRQVELPWQEQDWRHLTAQEQTQQLQAWRQSDLEQGFDLTHAPAMRLSLIRLGEASYHFTWSFHHLLLDGWSVFTVMGQVFSGYETLCQGKSMARPVSRPYRDYIGWLRRQDLGQAERFWRETLRGFTTPTLLDISRSQRRTTEPPGKYRNQAHLLSEVTMANLQQLARRHQVTLNTLVQGAWALLLARYSGQHDIVFGMTVSGRPPELAGVEAMVGLFINTLPMRVQVPAYERLIPWLQRLQAQQAEVRQYEYSPLVQVQAWSEVPRGQSLFENLLVFENYPLDASFVQNSSLRIEPVQAGGAYTNYPLTVSIIPAAEMLVGMKYAGTHFTDESIQRMLGHLQTLLEGMVANPQQRLAELPLLTEAERQQQLFAWNATQTAYPQETCLQTLFEEQVEVTPDAIAVIYEGQQLSYAMLDWQATQLADNLRKRGIGPEQLVGICLPRSLEMVIGLLAVLKAGGAYVPLDPTYPQQRLAFIVEDTQLKVLLTLQHLIPILPAANAEIICLDAANKRSTYTGVDELLDRVQPDNLAYVIYTSGSTGNPKGVQITHRALVNFLASMRTQPGLTRQDILLAVTSISFDIAGLEIFLPLMVGARLVLVRREVSRDGEQLKQQLVEQGATVMQATPTTWRLLLDAGWRSSQEMRLLCGGEALPAKLARSLSQQATLWNMYGPTETTVWSTCHQVREVGDHVSIGRPIANTQIYLLDAQLEPVPIGVTGHLYIGGIGLSRGYCQRPDITAEQFLPDPFSLLPGARLYRTGDLARYLADGNVEYVGRADYQVKVHGYRIELGEIEAVLSRYPAIREAVVLAREEQTSDKQEQEGNEKYLVAYLVAHQELPPDISEIRAYLQQHLPEYMIPTAYLWLAALPTLPNGKVDRRALPAPGEARPSLKKAYVAPRTALEQYLADVWRKLLKLEDVGVHDNFFELGGDSIKAALAINKVQERLKVLIYVVALFDAPTIAQLATSLAEQHPEVVSTLFGQESLAFSQVDERPEHAQSAQTASEVLSSIPPRADDAGEAFPLSFAQERLWFLDQWEPQNAAYNIDSILHLQGTLLINVLERSLNEIVCRHEVLRTTFQAIDGHPRQIIAPQMHLSLPVVDLGGLSVSEQEITLQLLTREQFKRPFDLGQGPLLRTILLRVRQEDHRFLLTIHHSISDGWSMGLLFRELNVLYGAFLQGKPSPLPQLPIQYADYALWQRQRLQGETLQQQLAYWRTQLQGSQTLLALPTDRSRPAVQTFAGATHRLTLSTELSVALKTLSQREGVTLFMTLLAAFQTLLARYSQQEDISVGTYIAGRTHFETENLIGFFTNNLVLRTDLSGDPSFRALLKRASQVAQGAYEHQDIPFEKLIQELQPERNPSYTPLFQVMLIYQNMPEYEPSLPGLTIQPLRVGRTRSNFDLSLWVTEWLEKKLAIAFDYNTDLFDATTIERWAGHFQTLLQAIVANPARRLSALSLLSATEWQTVLRDWNASEESVATNIDVEQLFAVQVARTPDTIALVYEEQHLTYAELARRAEQLAIALQRQGIGPEMAVGICLERSLEMVVALLSVLKAGAAYVPLDPTYPQERLTFMIRQAQISLLLTQSQLMSRLPSSEARALCLDTDWSAIASGSQPLLHLSNEAERLAYVIYTSGSTGEPKGVAVAHRSLTNFVQAAARLFEVAPGDRVLQFASLSFDASAEEIYPCLLQGGTLVLRTEMMLSDTAHFVQTCQRWGLTVLDLPTAYWHELTLALEREQLVLPHGLRLVIIGGEQALAERLASWQRHGGSRVALINTYGPTETTVAVTAHRVRIGEDQEPCEAAVLGRAIANVQLYVLDRYGQPLPIGIPGELYIGGEGIARGYLGRLALTAERFVPNPFDNRPGARLYRTGDLVRLLPDGSLEYRGRVDRQVKLRGFRIELGEIEAVLARHPSVREAVVLLREDSVGDKRLVAYVVSEPRQSITSGELRSYVQQQLPAYMLPSSFVQLEAMPRTPNGKVDRRALPAPQNFSQGRERVWEVPQTPTEELLADLWSQVLHSEQVSRHDHFFESGGHSLLATQLVARVRDLFGIELPLRTIFEIPVLSALAEQIEIARDSQQLLQLPPLQPRAVREEMPLSYAQQRLWFLDQFQPDSASYNIPLAMRFTGKLDLLALQGSLMELMRRQEILRTTFTTQQGQPRQIIVAQPTIKLPIVDLSTLSEQEKASSLDQIAQQEAQRPFNLAQGPLLRTTLIQLDHETQVLLLTMHHIITDAWSMGVFFRELTQLYRARINSEPSPLPELTIQYADYACWQRQWLEGVEAEGASIQEQQLAYWRAHLAGAPPLLELPTDHPRPQEQTYRGAHHTFTLSPELVSSLRRLGRQEGATLFMLLLTAFGGLLSRYSGQEDLVVGTPIANRRHAQLEGMIGFFVNTLALRLSLSRRLSVREVLRHVREVALGAYAHQDVPFEQVVEVLHPQRDLSHTPLFQVVFVLQNVATAALELPDVNVQLLAVESGIARFDLTLTMQERVQDVLGVLEYNRDLFEPGTIERMAVHLCLLLEGMVADPEQQLATLPLLTEAEQQQLLLEWNETRTAYPDNCGLIALFEQHVQHAPDAVALVFGEQQASYSELDARANQLAHYLQQSGVSTETLVGLCLERSIEMVVGILAILKAGGAYVPLDLSYPQERLAFMLQDAQITLLLSQERLQARFATAEVRVVCLDEAWPAIAQQSRQAPQTEASPEHLAYVIYTSGSTGQPKGVQVQQGSVLRLVCGVNYVPLSQHIRVLQLAPISFDAATFELWASLVHGGRCVLFAGDLPSVQGIGEVLHREQINLLWLTASLFNVVVDEAPAVLIGLRYLLIGGEALSVRHVRRGLDCLPGVQIINGYGPTENTTFSCCEPIDPSLPADVHTIPIGRPIANTQAYVLDELGQAVPVGVPGELYLGGAGLARGYLRRPELTAERFVPHPFGRHPGERLYRTGDVVRYLPDGRLEFVGRRDGQVKLRGFRIELGEIEATLMGHERVRDAVVILHQEVMSEKRLVAYVVAQPPEALVISELRHYLQDRLPEYMVPAAFVQLEALPLTPNGKLDRQALPAPESGYVALDSAHAAPRTSEEEVLAGIWATVLNLDRVGVHDNFFELGGDSILSIQIVAKATAAGLPLTPRQLFQHQTIAQLAALAGTTQPVAADQQQVQGSMPLLPVQHWFFAQQLAEPQHWNQAVMLETRQWLDPALFAQALHALLSHHDALRLRAQHQADGWQLWYATPDERIPFSLVDLTALAGPAQLAALSASAKALQASLNLVHGPIIRAALFTLGSRQPQRLLLIIHHLAVDIVSWSMVLEDLQTAYQQLCRGQAIHLPAKTTSFQHWSRRLQEYAQSAVVSSQLAYWLKQPWADVHALPLDMPATRAANIQGSARAVAITLGAEETQALLSEVHKAYRTQINDVLLTALVLAFARWTGQSVLLVHLEGHGREDILDNVDLSRTVGWFTVLMPLVLKLESKQEPGEALKWIKEQLRGIPQGGMSFGLLRYLNHDGAIREQLAALPQPEVSFNYAGRSTTIETEELFASAAELPGPSLGLRNLRPHVLDISGAIVEGQLWLEWVYSENLHRRSTIEQLANAYLEALQTLIRHCQTPEAGGYTPSDFPEAELSQEALDALVASLSETMTKAGKNIEAIYPLSPMQEGMLFHSLYAPHLEVYFEQFTYTLQGELNSAAFKEAWRQIVAAHPVLRTLFLWEGREKPLQVVLQHVELPWQEQDWRHLAAEEQAQRLHAWVQRDQAQGFDLASAPALRLSLIRLGEMSYHFTWSFHHLLLDGWSVFTVMGQVFSGYEALCQGKLMALPASRPYRDYIGWLQRQDLGQAECFWREMLRGFTTPSSLGITRSQLRKAEPVGQYRNQQLRLSEATTTGLQHLARQHQLTLNTLAQGAWALLLARYSGQQDIVFGTTVSGRPPELAGVEAMVGLFINTLPMRVQIAAHERLIPWLQRLQAQQVEARQYEYSPLVQVQVWSEVPRGQPLFEHLLIFANYPADASFVEEMSLKIERMQVVERTNYPLTMSITPLAQMLVRVSYAGTHFTDESISRMLAHLQTVLEGMVANPQLRLAELPLLTEAERQQQLFAWNATHTDEPQQTCLHALFEAQVERAPEATALFFEEQQLTYSELNARANQLAHYLQHLGVGPEVCVGICVERSIAMIVGVLAVLKAGGAYVPLDPAYPLERLALMLQETQAPVLLTQQSLLPSLQSHQAGEAVGELAREIICLDRDWPSIEREHTCNPHNQVATANLAYVIYTSGSTGRPKGTLVEQRGLANLVAVQVHAFAIEPTSHILQFASLSFDAAVSEIFTTLLCGAALFLIPKESLFPGPGLVHRMEEQAISVVTLPPSILSALPAAQLPALHTLVVAGEASSGALVERWAGGRRFLNAYGPTEASVCATIATCADGSQTPPIGRPIANVQVYVLDPWMQPVPVGVTGELYIASIGLARGYLYRPELTAEYFLPDPFSQQEGSRLYRTGDLVRYLANGELEYVGRRDRQVKVRGYRIEVGEIEAVLSRHPAIGEVVVLARESSASGEPTEQTEQRDNDKRLVAYLVARQQPAPSSGELRAFLGQHLPEYMVPSVFLFLDALPTLPNGKVDRRALPTPEEVRTSWQTASQAPRTALEQYLAQLWQGVLKLEAVGIHEHFFELGGDSIKAALLINKVQERFGTLVYAVALFDAPTIAQLASYLAQQYPEVVRTLFGLESLPTAVTTMTSTRSAQQPCIDREKVQVLRALIAPLAPPPAQLEQPMSKNPPAVFVLSPPRSGSTLLRVMLAGHPQLFAPPELELLSFQTLGERQAAFSGRNGFWLEGLIRAVMDLKGYDAQSAQRLIAEYEAQDLPTHSFYGLLQRWLGPRLLVDKTPAYALDRAILQRGEQEFEQARYLHLVRHPQAMIRSFEEARLDQVFFRHPHRFSRRELAELVWVVCQQNIQAFLRTVPPERQQMVVFEELVREPRRVMEGICQFLGVDYEPAMIEPYQGQRMTDGISAHSKMIGDIKFHEHRGIDAGVAERWKQEPERQAVAEMTWELAASLGYVRSEGEQPAQGKMLPRIAPRPREEQQLPLSYAQERLWFLQQWEPTQAAYTIDTMLQLQGALSVEMLDRSLQELVRRHEVLRTSLQAEEGQPRQVVATHICLPLPVVDLTGLATSEREAQGERLAREQLASPFDLGKAPLLRTTLIRMHAQRHLFVLTMHHSISDGWSMSIFNQELTALYEAFLHGQPSPLPELPIQYADYALWQRGTAHIPELQSQLRYWQRQLADLPLLALPTDHARPSIQRFRGRSWRFRLSEQLTKDLKSLSQREGVTLFMTLLAGFQVLLSRYSGQTDIVVGTPIANRSRSEVEHLIGPFVNTLVLRLDLVDNPTVQQLLAEVRRITLQAYAHQDLPFDKLVEVLNPQRSLSHHPLFQVMFVLHNTPVNSLAMQALQVGLMSVETTIAHFDLTLNLYASSRGLVGDIEYDRDLFEEETIERLSQHYQQLLLAMTSSPQKRPLTLPLLTEGEQQQLRNWNATAMAYAHDVCFHDLFEEQALRTPEAIALVYEEQHLSYGELNARANQLAHYLSTHYTLAPEALIALALDRSPLMLIGLLAILKAGAAYVPLDPDYPQHRLAFVLQETRAPVVLTQTTLESRIPAHQGATLCLDRKWPAISHEPTYWRPPRIEAQQLAYTIYTSGSTGMPKGVQISHRALVNFLSSMRHQPGLTQQDTLLAVTSISFDIAGLELWLPLMVGARLVLLSRAVSRDGEQLKQQLAEQGATMAQATPTTWRLLLEAGWCSRPEMRLLCGGEALPPELARELCRQPATLWNLYGPTETTIWSTLQQVSVVEGSVSIGRPIANTQVYLLDKYQQQVLSGVVGELCIGGDGLSRGYLRQPELTAEKFRPDPFSLLPGARLYHTGDLARYRSDGSLEILGRLDSQIKMWGYRIELGEIEAILAQHPAVSAAVVVLQEDEAGEKRLIAYIVPPQHQQAALKNEVEAISAAKETQAAVDLRGFLRERLPAYMVPSIVIPIPALPLLPNGKVDRRSLSSPEWLAQVAPELALQSQELDAAEKPRTPIEQQLVAIWSQLLRLERVGIHQDFFQLGGHSLLATQVIARVRSAFQIDLPLQSFFVAPTIANMALAIEEQQRQQSDGQVVGIPKAEQDQGTTLLEQLDQLSDEEMEALFATMVTEEEIEG